MPREFEQGPFHEPTSQRQPHQEAEQIDNAPRSPRGQRDEPRGERSHAEMVAMLRQDMAQYIAEYDPDGQWFNPVEWMRDKLIFETATQSVEVYGRNVEPAETPHANLVLAWEVISHPYVTEAIYRSNVENGIKVKAQALGHTITLDHNESRFLDAMAEACGIPTVYGQVTVAGKTPQTFDIRKKDAAP
jgi:hypothetical protein